MIKLDISILDGRGNCAELVGLLPWKGTPQAQRHNTAETHLRHCTVCYDTSRCKMTMRLWKERFTIVVCGDLKCQVKISRDRSCLPISILIICVSTAVSANSTIYNSVSFKTCECSFCDPHIKKRIKLLFMESVF